MSEDCKDNVLTVCVTNEPYIQCVPPGFCRCQDVRKQISHFVTAHVQFPCILFAKMCMHNLTTIQCGYRLGCFVIRDGDVRCLVFCVGQSWAVRQALATEDVRWIHPQSCYGPILHMVSSAVWMSSGVVGGMAYTTPVGNVSLLYRLTRGFLFCPPFCRT